MHGQVTGSLPARPERDRAAAFLLARHASAADRIEPWEGGRALLAPTLPDLWDANHLILDRPGEWEAPDLMALAARVLGEGGARHRAVVVPDETEARRLAPGFAAAGWDRDRLLLMALRGTPRARPGAPVARELPPDAIGALRREMVMLEPWGSAGVAAQLAEHQERLRRALASRCFVAPTGGRPLSSCELFSGGGVAEVADVGTLPAHRRARGHRGRRPGGAGDAAGPGDGHRRRRRLAPRALRPPGIRAAGADRALPPRRTGGLSVHGSETSGLRRFSTLVPCTSSLPASDSTSPTAGGPPLRCSSRWRRRPSAGCRSTRPRARSWSTASSPCSTPTGCVPRWTPAGWGWSSTAPTT